MGWTAVDIPDLTGSTAVVTGGNGGLGLETVRELARKGAHVIIGARNLEKAATAQADVRAEVADASLEVRKLDLSSLASVEEFAEGVVADHPVIDMLFNNAGVMATAETETADGFEMQFGTNHLGHFALTRHLLAAIARSAAGRIVTTTSTARYTAGKYDLDNAHHRGEYDPWRAYGYSKLANVHFTIELDRRLRTSGSTIKALMADPGFSDTDLQSASVRSDPTNSRSRLFERWTPRIGQSAARGALPQLRAGTDPAARGGALYRPMWITAGVPVVGRVGSRLSRPDHLTKLWEISEVDTGSFDVTAIVESAG